MKKIILLISVLSCASLGFGQGKQKKIVKTGDSRENLSIPIIDHSVHVYQPQKANTQNNTINFIRENTLAKREGLTILRDENGMPTQITGIPKHLSTTLKAGRVDAVSRAFNYLSAVSPFLKNTNVEAEFQVKDMQSDELNQTHIRMKQTYKGLPVYGAEIIMHQTGSDVSSLNGKMYPTPSIEDVTPRFSEDNIGEIAQKDIQQAGGTLRTLTFAEKAILKYEKPKAELMIYHKDDNPEEEHLAYQVVVRPSFHERWIYMVDAQTGEILDKYNYTCTIDGPAKATATDLNGKSVSINTYSVNNTYYLIDASKAMFASGTKAISLDDPQKVLWTITANGSSVDDITVRQVSSTNNTWSNPESVSAHYNASLAYDYYYKTFGRNSLDGKGGTIISIINLTDENSKAMDNAFWNGEFMGYGRGSSYFKPLAGGLDVAGHEMTHGVVEKTANLAYKGQSGAINESMADIFGTLIDRDDWAVGEDVTKSGKPLRDLSNPNQGGKSLNDDGFQPANMGQYYTGSQDNYGVHINSGIPNFAYYKIASATNMTKEKAEKIYYRALTNYLTSSSKFIDLRRAIIQSAADLYGATGTEVAAAKSAFDAVGVTDANAPTPTPSGSTTTQSPVPTPSNDVPVNTNKAGSYLLSYDPVDKALYVLDTVGSKYVKIATNITLTHKPSVTDDGKYAYFVNNHAITRIDLSTVKPFSPTDQSATVSNVVIDKAGWDNVAISKDGKRLAAVSTTAEPYIYVFDLTSTAITIPAKKFKLYNPTYSTGVSTSQVLYPDAIEWDYDGDNLVYDAYNEVKSADGKVISFWDVGFLNGWNSQTNTFGSGLIQKLVSNLETGESITNPSFSKNSSNMLAFDYQIEYNTDLFDNYVVGVNMARPSEWQIIVAFNSDLGYPDYSRTDNFVIYNTYDSKAKYNNTSIITLDSKDKRKGVESSIKTLVEKSAYNVWYTLGTRKLPSKQSQTITLSKVADKNLSDPSFSISASASSGLGVIVSIASGPANLLGSTVSLTGTAGKVYYGAYQDGSTSYYSVSKVDSFCVLPAKPTISVVKKSDTNGAFWEYTSSAATGNIWYKNGQILESARGERVIQVSSGASFNVQVVTADGCASALSATRQDAALERILANEPTVLSLISVFPNPTNDKIIVETPESAKIEKITLFSSTGLAVLGQAGNKTSKIEISLANLPQGNYLIEIQTSQGTTTQKITKQ